MRTPRTRRMVLLPSSLAVIISLAGSIISGCSQPATAPGQKPTLTAADKAKQAEMTKKAEASMRAEQIRRSNLSPEQKQALLNQVGASTGK